MREGFLQRLHARASATYRFWRHVSLRFWHDELFTKSAALAFQTTLALVPLFTIIVSILSAFPGFRDFVLEFESWLLSVLAPHTEAVVTGQLDQFIGRARELTTLGVLVLAVIAMMLLHTASDTLDAIFRVTKQRPLAARFMTYWTLLTLGPLIFAVGFSLTASLFAEGQTALGGLFQQSLGLFKAVLPFVIEWMGFTLLYWLVPSRPATFRDSLAAGAVAAVLFQVLKGAFALYLIYVASYESVYGALAAIPVTLLWLELAWATSLFGASIAASLPEWRAGIGMPKARTLSSPALEDHSR